MAAYSATVAIAAVPIPLVHSPKPPSFSLGPLPESPENLLCPLVATPQAAVLEVFCLPPWPVNPVKEDSGLEQVRTLKISSRPFHPLRLVWAAELLQMERLLVPLGLGWVFQGLRYLVLNLGKPQAN